MEEDLLVSGQSCSPAFAAGRDGIGQENASDPLNRLCRTEASLARAVVYQTVRDLIYKAASASIHLDAEIFVLSGAIKPWLEGTGDGNVTTRFEKLVELANTSRKERLASRQARKAKRQRVAA